jgi:hypothetical protein
MRHPRPHRGTALGALRSPKAAAPRRGPRRSSPALRTASAPACARGRDGARRRPAGRHPAPARTRQPRHHEHLPPGNRQRRDHRHRPRTTVAGDLRKRRAPDHPIGASRPHHGSAGPTGRPGHARDQPARAGPRDPRLARCETRPSAERRPAFELARVRKGALSWPLLFAGSSPHGSASANVGAASRD